MNLNDYIKPLPVLLWHLTRLQAVQFGKKKSNRLVLFLFLSAGLYALYGDYADKRIKTATIAAFRQQSDSLLRAMKAGIVADTSTAEGKAVYSKSSNFNSGLWNTKLPSYKLPVSTALYNIGQSDVFTYYYLFSAENFEMQWLKQTEITNPLRSLAGHFDVSFWVVYLLPLLILLLSFNALSAEKDNGNWRLISAQGITEKHWLQSKFLIVALSCFMLLLLVAVIGTVINFISFHQAFAVSDGLFFLSAIVYLFFWLSLFYFINSLRQSTAYNALVSGVAWIGICLVLPVVISKAGEMISPVDNTVISTFSRRPQNPKIEADKAFAAGLVKQLVTEDSFYKNADTDTASPALMLRTYHAWHLLLHRQRWPIVRQYFHHVEKRQALTNWSTLVNPAAGTDGYLTALADNDAAAFHHFTEATEGLHNDLHKAFFEKLFNGKSFGKKEYDQLPQFTYNPNAIPVSVAAYMVCMLLLCTGFFAAGNNRLKRNFS